MDVDTMLNLILRCLFKTTWVKVIGIITVTFLILIIFQQNSEAAVMLLKNGATIEGDIVSEDDIQVKIRSYRTRLVLTYKREQIKKIVFTEEEQKKRRKKSAQEYSIDDYQLRIGLLPMVGFPIGDLAPVVDLGYGGNVDIDFLIPIKGKNINLGIGLTTGFHMYSTNEGNMMMVPILLNFKFLYHTRLGIRPFVRISGGMTLTMLGGSSFDPTMYAGVGIGYINAKIPFLEFFVEGGYRMIFESIRGDFVNAQVGVAYRITFSMNK
jgi:hypothetical protein